MLLQPWASWLTFSWKRCQFFFWMENAYLGMWQKLWKVRPRDKGGWWETYNYWLKWWCRQEQMGWNWRKWLSDREKSTPQIARYTLKNKEREKKSNGREKCKWKEEKCSRVTSNQVRTQSEIFYCVPAGYSASMSSDKHRITAYGHLLSMVARNLKNMELYCLHLMHLLENLQRSLKLGR